MLYLKSHKNHNVLKIKRFFLEPKYQSWFYREGYPMIHFIFEIFEEEIAKEIGIINLDVYRLLAC